MEQDRLTVEKVAAALGVSKTTVSRAISGKGRISVQTRERIMEYLQKHNGFELLRTLRSPAAGSSNLALVIPAHFVQLDLPFLRKCMGAVCHTADQRGYDVLLCYADTHSAPQLERQLADRKVDGVILSRTVDNDPCIHLLEKYRVPYVVIGRVADPSVMQVDNDQLAAAAEMTGLLHQLNYRRIAYMGGSLLYTVNADRLAGYRQATQQAGIAVDENLILSNIETPDQRTEALDLLLLQKPECILCCDDALAHFVVRDLQRRGIRVPEQMRVASLYDSELLEDMKPSVTAVHFDGAALSAVACRLLLDHLSGKNPPTRIIHGHQLVLRESTK
ncbi:MAG: LacI family DNA-binding transcriptional regulator [Oscillospiraceae bacterium]|nr:LacI family DNA-binding transcriptional regulator [Oscillospiraceae bacterium]